VNKFKSIKPGDVFSTIEDGKSDAKTKGDKRTFKCITDSTVELITPSQYQITMDSAYRDGSWKKTCVNDVEPEWYKQRGFEVVS